MSVFRVLKLMDQLHLDTTFYKEQLSQLMPRMNSHMMRRGPWQRAMFAKYYEDYGLTKPDILQKLGVSGAKKSSTQARLILSIGRNV